MIIFKKKSFFLTASSASILVMLFLEKGGKCTYIA